MKGMFALALSVAVFAAGAAQMKSATRNGRVVEFAECPKCEMRVRFSADAKYATVNLSKLLAGNPDKHRLNRQRTQMIERAFAVMEMAAAAKEPFWGADIAKGWHRTGLPNYVVSREGKAVVLVKDVGEPGGKSREVALYNMSDAPHEFNVSFASLDLGGNVAVLDLTERAIPDRFTAELSVKVPAKGAKVYRLDAEKRNERTVFSAESADVSDETQLVWKKIPVSRRSHRTLEFTCHVEKDSYFYVTFGDSKPVTVTVRAMKGLDSLAIAEVIAEKGVRDIRVYAADGETLPKISVMRIYR